MFSKGRGATPSRFRLSREDFGKLPFPHLTDDKIRFLGRELQKVYRIKKEKKKEAEELLNSIDDYILTALEITLPELKDEQFYTTTFANIKGGRFDPAYYQPKFKQMTEILRKAKFQTTTLGEMCNNNIKGVLPTYDEKGSKIKVLQIRNITRNGDFELSDIFRAKEEFAKKNPNCKLKENDLIIVITGATIGKVAVYNINEEFYLGGDMIKVQLKNIVEPFYLLSYLLSPIGQMQIQRNITGATNKHLSPTDALNFLIPIPPLSVQQKIAKEVKSRREKAKALTKEAKEIIIKTKEEVERMIIGEKNQIRR